MRSYRCLFGFMDFNVSLWVLICLIRPYGSSLHIIVPFTFDSNVALWVLICPYLSLWVSNGSLWVRKSSYASL